jgi:hypothetical protein
MPAEYNEQPHDIALRLLNGRTEPSYIAKAQVYALLAINDRLAAIESHLETLTASR